MMRRKGRQMSKVLRWFWGKQSLKQRVVLVALASPFALLACILQIVGNSTHNDPLWWFGMVLSLLLTPLVMVTLVLIMSIRKRQKPRERKQIEVFSSGKLLQEVEAMGQDVVGKISAEDWRVIEANQLGAPVGRYGLRQDIIGLFRWSGLGVIFASLAILLLAAIHVFSFSGTSFLSSFAPWAIGLLSLMVGIWTWLVSLLLAKQGVLVCENGFLKRANTRSKVVRWNEIGTIRKDSFLSGIYYLDLQGGKELTLGSYEHLDELVELIRQRSGLV